MTTSPTFPGPTTSATTSDAANVVAAASIGTAATASANIPPQAASEAQGIVLFAHGSRDPLWHQPMEAVAARVRSQAPHALVHCAYLELSTPDLATVVQTLHAQGVRDISVLPMFLGIGKHAREDLPALVEMLRLRYIDTRIGLQPAVGQDPRLIELLAQIALGKG